MQHGHLHSRHCRRRRSQQARQMQSSSTGGRSLVPYSNSNTWQRLQAAWTHILGGKQPLQQETAPRQRRQQQQQQQGRDARCWVPRQTRPLNLSSVPLPNFVLVGVAIGNGLTDPLPQTRALASECCAVATISWGMCRILQPEQWARWQKLRAGPACSANSDATPGHHDTRRSCQSLSVRKETSCWC